MNREWHVAHRMPARATLEQRLAWHLEHARACTCREMPEGIRGELEKRGLNPPPPRLQAKVGRTR